MCRAPNGSIIVISCCLAAFERMSCLVERVHLIDTPHVITLYYTELCPRDGSRSVGMFFVYNGGML